MLDKVPFRPADFHAHYLGRNATKHETSPQGATEPPRKFYRKAFAQRSLIKGQAQSQLEMSNSVGLRDT